MNENTFTLFFPRWATKALELAGFDMGDTSSGRQTHSQKHQVNVALMNHVLETCDIDTYAYSKEQLELEQAMSIEMNCLLKNHTLDLVPRS